MSRPDVLVVGDVDSVHVHRLVTGLKDRAGLEVRTAGFSERTVARSPSIKLGWGRTPPADMQFLLAVPRLAQVLRRTRPAVVNAHYVSSYGLMTALAMRLAFPLGARPALVQTAWGTDLLVTARASRSHSLLARLALHEADLVTGDSLDLADVVRDIAPGVRFERFVFGPPASLLSTPRLDEPIILSSRRLDPDTRIPTIVDGFRRARSLAPETLDGWRLVIAGDGSIRSDIERSVAGDSSIELVGQLDQANLARLLVRSSAVVSIPVSDATSAALLEAMAAGVVPIVNDLPANQEWVDDGVGVILGRDPTPDELAAGMIDVVERGRTLDRDQVRHRVGGVTWERELDRMAGWLAPYLAGDAAV